MNNLRIIASIFVVAVLLSTVTPAHAGNAFPRVLGIQARNQALGPIQTNSVLVEDAEKLQKLGIHDVKNGDTVQVINLGNGDWYVRNPKTGQSLLTKEAPQN